MKLGLLIRYWLALALVANTCIITHADVLDNWTTNQISTNSFGMQHVVFGNGIYVASGESGDYGGFYTSVDGLRWKLQYTDLNGWGISLNYSSGRFAGVARGGGSCGRCFFGWDKLD
jgi:hypothetical protein